MVTSNRRLMLTCLASLSLSVAVVSGPAAERPSPAVSNSTAIAAAPEKKPTNGTRSAAIARASGREIFLREWIPNDPRSHGGDGLGPVFNESSCVSCHNQGGVGGGGAEAKNVMVISAVRTNFDDSRIQAVPRQLAPPRAAVSPSDGFTPPARTLEPPSFNDSFNRGQEPADPFDE